MFLCGQWSMPVPVVASAADAPAAEAATVSTNSAAPAQPVTDAVIALALAQPEHSADAPDVCEPAQGTPPAALVLLVCLAVTSQRILFITGTFGKQTSACA